MIKVVSTSIIAQASADSFRGLAEILEQVLCRKLAQLWLVGEQLVGVIYISLEMLIMMNLHGEGVDSRL